MYLNRVYFGHGAYGIGAAARTYFNKAAKGLTPVTAAFLAGLIQAPSLYDPVMHLELAQSREGYVLQGMVAINALSPEEADKAAQEDIKSELHIQASARQSKAPHFVDHVLADLETMFGSADVQQGGIVVRTTLDLDLQLIAEQAATFGVQDLGIHNGNKPAPMSADPRTGGRLAWAGSADDAN